MSPPIPKFSHLPIDQNGPHHNAWGLYGKDDQLGTLNRLTDSIVASAAAGEVRSGTRISLDWPLDAQADLPFFGRQPFVQELYQKPPRIVNDDVWHFNTQSSSQWDGLRHFAYQREACFYNGVTLDQIHDASKDSAVLGIGAWSEHGIVGRGILLDYHAWRTRQGLSHDAFATDSAISAATLRAVAEAQGTEIRFGDILLVRSGYMAAYGALSRAEIEALRDRPAPHRYAGVEQSEEMLEFLWTYFSACAGDHPSWEAWPTPQPWSLHEVMLSGWGMPIGELFDLEALAKQCQEVSRWSFFFVSKPVNVPGGVASPPNAVAIF